MATEGAGHNMAIKRAQSTVVPGNVGRGDVRATTEDVACCIKRGRSVGEVRAKRTERGAEVAKCKTVRFTDSVGAGRRPIRTIANLKDILYGGPRGGGGIMIVVGEQ